MGRPILERDPSCESIGYQVVEKIEKVVFHYNKLFTKIGY